MDWVLDNRCKSTNLFEIAMMTLWLLPLKFTKKKGLKYNILSLSF